MTNYEPVVPLAELGIFRQTGPQMDAWSQVAGVSVVRDYLDRPSVSLADAYRLADARRKAEAEYADARVAEQAAHKAEVDELRARMEAAFRTAADAAKAAAMPGMTPSVVDAAQTNAGITAARQLWQQASPNVRREVWEVEVTNWGGCDVTTFDLKTNVPLDAVKVATEHTVVGANAAAAARERLQGRW